MELEKEYVLLLCFTPSLPIAHGLSQKIIEKFSERGWKDCLVKHESGVNPVRNSSGSSPHRPTATMRECGGSGFGYAGGALAAQALAQRVISNGVNSLEQRT